MGEVTNAMQDVMGVFGSLIGGLSTIVTTVTASPVLMIGLGATCGGIAISWFKRLTGQRSGRRK